MTPMHGGVAVADSTLSIVIPARNAARSLGDCLAAIARGAGRDTEVIVVDDGSDDDTGDVARRYGATVLRNEKAGGPAAARNAGVTRAAGDVVLFVDADVVLSDDAIQRVRQVMADPTFAAVFGSYDDAPASRGLVSDFRNLLHHFVHQFASEDSSSFWAGCGAVRKSVFLACGGFDERYQRPSVEDIELGARLTQAGHRVRLEKQLLAKHLKRWTLASVLVADIRDRAYPWSRLILETGHMPVDLNLRYRDRASAAFVWLAAVLALTVLIVEAPWEAALLGGMAGAVVAVVLLNRDFYRFLAARPS